jgi:hypothetical protein
VFGTAQLDAEFAVYPRLTHVNVNDDARRSNEQIFGNRFIKTPARVIVPVAIAPFSSGPPRKAA